MGIFRYKKKITLRRLLLIPAWLGMLTAIVYYLYEYRNFAVDDTRFAAEIREAAKRPIVFDDDCPEMTEEQLKQFKRVHPLSEGVGPKRKFG